MQAPVQRADLQDMPTKSSFATNPLESNKGFLVLNSLHQSCLDKEIPLPVLLLLDCHTAHLTKATIERARELRLHLWYIHPHATAVLQVSTAGNFLQYLMNPFYAAHKKKTFSAIGHQCIWASQIWPKKKSL